jgi:hypothetical protein
MIFEKFTLKIMLRNETNPNLGRNETKTVEQMKLSHHDFANQGV